MASSTTNTLREFRSDRSWKTETSSPARWILSHLLHHPLLPLILIASSLVNNTAYSNIQVLVGRCFDVLGRASWSPKDLLTPILVIAASALIQGLTGLSRNYSVELLAQRIERDIREEYVSDLLGKSQTFHGRQRVGDLMARATYDAHTLNLMFSPGIMLITDSALAYLVPMVMIALIHPALLLAPLAFSVFLLITILDYNRRLKPVSLAQQQQHGRLSAVLEEAVAGIATVKANGRESYEWDKFVGNARKYRDYFVRQGIIQARYWPMLVFAFFWGAALFHGLSLWRAGSLSLGQVVGFMGLFGTFRFVTFISLFSFNMVQHGLASARRILEILTAHSDLDENPSGESRPLQGTVEFRSVCFQYDEVPVLAELSFSVAAGETVAIVGPTGSGKSSLTRLINRIFDPQEGSVLIDGIEARRWNLESLRSQISAIEQDVFLFSRSIRHNIAFSRPGASAAQIEEASRQAQAEGFILSLPQGYDTVIGERGVTLSGGQKQRIAIARAFLADPRILILDDSTSAIDSRTEDEIQKAIRAVSRSRTTFIITHRLSQIRWADRVLVLKGGRLLDQGRHQELLDRCDDYRRIFARL